MKKLLALAALINLKISTVLGYHGTQPSGGSSLPIHESMGDNFLYIAIPFIVYTFFLNEVIQLYLERRYADTTLKNAEDHRDLTIGLSAVITFMLLFTGLFQALPNLSIPVYSAVIGAIVVIGLIMNKREMISKIYRTRFNAEED